MKLPRFLMFAAILLVYQSLIRFLTSNEVIRLICLLQSSGIVGCFCMPFSFDVKKFHRICYIRRVVNLRNTRGKTPRSGSTSKKIELDNRRGPERRVARKYVRDLGTHFWRIRRNKKTRESENTEVQKCQRSTRKWTCRSVSGQSLKSFMILPVIPGERVRAHSTHSPPNDRNGVDVYVRVRISVWVFAFVLSFRMVGFPFLQGPVKTIRRKHIEFKHRDGFYDRRSGVLMY